MAPGGLGLWLCRRFGKSWLKVLVANILQKISRSKKWHIDAAKKQKWHEKPWATQNKHRNADLRHQQQETVHWANKCDTCGTTQQFFDFTDFLHLNKTWHGSSIRSLSVAVRPVLIWRQLLIAWRNWICQEHWSLWIDSWTSGVTNSTFSERKSLISSLEVLIWTAKVGWLCGWPYALYETLKRAIDLRRRDGCVVVSEKAKRSWESVHPFQLEVSVARSDMFIVFFNFMWLCLMCLLGSYHGLRHGVRESFTLPGLCFFGFVFSSEFPGMRSFYL